MTNFFLEISLFARRQACSILHTNHDDVISLRVLVNVNTWALPGILG